MVTRYINREGASGLSDHGESFLWTSGEQAKLCVSDSSRKGF